MESKNRKMESVLLLRGNCTILHIEHHRATPFIELMCDHAHKNAFNDDSKTSEPVAGTKPHRLHCLNCSLLSPTSQHWEYTPQTSSPGSIEVTLKCYDLLRISHPSILHCFRFSFPNSHSPVSIPKDHNGTFPVPTNGCCF